jgi:hypothetical protein
MRKLDSGKSYQDFREAWRPPVNDPAKYFDIPVIVINGQSVQNPSEIVSVALVWADVQKAITSYQQIQVTEDVREEKVGKMTQQSVETRFCRIVDIDVLGS